VNRVAGAAVALTTALAVPACTPAPGTGADLAARSAAPPTRVASRLGSAPAAPAAPATSPTPASRRPAAPKSPRSPVAPAEYRFPIATCHVRYAAAHHDYPATDIFAARGCPVVSPVNGVVDEVSRTDTWSSSTNRGAARGGRFVSVLGADRVRYYLAHLDAVERGIRAGQPVTAGQRLGRVGDSGSAHGTGTHLHFGISWPTPAGTWWVRRGEVPPTPYLDAWRKGRPRSPAHAVEARRKALGPTPRCASYC
jgi:peptidoglycan LD-endopeptidase LytH